jgi:hypothetical protein
MLKIILLVLFSIDSLFSFAPVISKDLFSKTDYPQGYFRNPLDIPIQLAANFGELRSNHFHMGFDIRTNQRENLPVRAAADGYISKIKIERFGFGHAIYINHPNGYTTLYAHLNDFYDTLNRYVKNKQYADQQWEQEIDFAPNQFPVTKGQFIANSGNTGGSEGPHLHFEIRDTKTGNNLNPWLFGFGLTDKTPPSIYRLYYFDRRYSTYGVSPQSIPITGSTGKYASLKDVVVLSSPVVSFGISALDKLNISSFKYGIYEASLSVDDSVQSAFQLNDISYNDTRYVNGSIDYKTKATGGPYIQHLSRLPGNYSSTFSPIGNGKIVLTDTLIHQAEILVKDAAGNSSVLHFQFRWDPSKTRDEMFIDNTLLMVPGRENELKTQDIEADFSAKAFYDTVPFVLRSEVSNDPNVVSLVHYMHNFTVPVHDSFTVRIKPSVVFSDSLRDRVVLQLVAKNKVDVVKGEWKDDWMEAKFRDLEIVKLLMDTTPANVRPVAWISGGSVRNKKSITFVVKDNAGEIKSFKAFLDGNWYMFSRKSDLFIHTFDEKTAPGRHELKVIVEDMAGNITERNYSFIR